jgi:HSP20 family molecular chaperone IbpA
MQTDIIESMREQVRAIHRALTGDDVPEAEALDEGTNETAETITRRFAELEVMARALPTVAERVPPFTFTPAVDVIAADDEVILELALPGVDRGDVTVEGVPGGLVVSGIRRDRRAPRGSVFHAEIPRGPFSRAIPLPIPIAGEPRTELDRGVLRIHLTVGAATRRDDPRARDSNREPATRTATAPATATAATTEESRR